MNFNFAATNSGSMKFISKLLIALIPISITASAQTDTPYKKIYYKSADAENEALSIKIENAVSTDAETKFKLIITNKTNDYIIYKADESIFKIDGKEISPQERWLVIEPNKSDYRVVNAKGAGYNKIKNYSYVVDGLYRVNTEGGSITAPDFKLPASKNDFKAGNFTCELSKLEKETGGTKAKFKCTYSGNEIGFLMPAKVAVKMPDGNEYANNNSKAKTIVFLKKGDEDNFTLVWDRMQGGKATDMQKVDMLIKWNDAFKEAPAQKMKSETLSVDIDEAVSKDKGR
jgi:hypothetical protein